MPTKAELLDEMETLRSKLEEAQDVISEALGYDDDDSIGFSIIREEH